MPKQKREASWDPPDGGWGWVVVVCSLVLHGQAVGLLFSLSVMYVSWIEAFGNGRGVTSWVISICVAVMFGLGPVPAALANRYGFRAVVVVGGLLISAGYMLSYFATSVTFLMMTIGIIVGLGSCFVYLSAVAVVSVYFSARRSVAMGIATAGVGIGSMIAAPFLNFLIDMYGWRGTLLIVGAFQLNICVCGLLLRPLELKTFVCEEITSIVDGERQSAADDAVCEKKSLLKNSVDDIVKECGERGTEETKNSGASHIPTSCHRAVPERVRSITINECFTNGNESDGLYYDKLQVPGGEIDDKRHAEHSGSMMSMNDQHHKKKNLFSGVIDVRPFSSMKDLHEKTSSNESIPRHRYLTWKNSLDVLFARSVTDLDSKNKSSLLLVLPDNEDNQLISNGDSVYKTGPIESNPKDSEQLNDNEMQQGCCANHAKHLMQSLKNNKDILKDPTFAMFGFSNLLTNLSYVTPMMYLVDRAIDSGLSRGEGAFLIVLTGIGGIFGRLFIGGITYRVFPDRLMVYILDLTLGGIFTMLSPLCGDSLILHSIYATLIGGFIGGFATLVAVVTVDIMGLTKASESFGLLLTISGISSLIGMPLAGSLFDWTRSYTVSYVLMGLFLTGSALMLLPTAFRRRRKLKADEEEEWKKSSNPS